MGTYCFIKINNFNYNEINFENKLRNNDLHCAIFLDKNKEVSEIDFVDFDLELKTKIEDIEVWDINNKNYLIARLSDEVKSFHNKIINKYKVNHFYKDYVPHITLSYNFKDYHKLGKIKRMLVNKKVVLKDVQLKENNDNWKKENYE